MPATFQLTLDTTAPAGVTLTIGSGGAVVTTQDVTANVDTSDVDTTGYQVKLWGDVDGAANASIQATEGASSWIAFSAAVPVRLSDGDGLKTLNLKVRDDLGNQSAVVSEQVTLDAELLAVTVTVQPDRTEISKVSGPENFDTTNFTFQADSASQAWKVKVVPNGTATHDQGTQIPTTGGSANTSGGALAANTPTVVTIKGADLEAASPGDGPKQVKVFAQDASGNWSV